MLVVGTKLTFEAKSTGVKPGSDRGLTANSNCKSELIKDTGEQFS